MSVFCAIGLHAWQFKTEYPAAGVEVVSGWCRRGDCRYQDPTVVNWEVGLPSGQYVRDEGRPQRSSTHLSPIKIPRGS